MNWRRVLYSVVICLLVPILFVRLLLRGWRQAGYRRHWLERLGWNLPVMADRPVWIHAVSVGETRAAQPLVRSLLAAGHPVLLTHTTPTGRATGFELFGDAVTQCYLPYDTPAAVRRFLRHFRPACGMLMETEIWFNLIHACRRRHLPIYLINARLSEQSARGYAKVRHLAAQALTELSGIAAQTEADALRLEALGAREVAILGNMKFDVPPPHDISLRQQAMRELVGPYRPVMLFASTREGEEELLIEAFRQMQTHGLLGIMVPRHPQRFEAVGRLIEAAGLPMQHRSTNSPVRPATRILLGDSMGEMAVWYAVADVAFIGGSLVPLGGQNLLEACQAGCPVLIGPHTFNFAAAAESAVAAGAARRVDSPRALAHAADQLFRDAALRQQMGRAGIEFCIQHQGACRHTLDWLKRHGAPIAVN